MLKKIQVAYGAEGEKLYGRYYQTTPCLTPLEITIAPTRKAPDKNGVLEYKISAYVPVERYKHPRHTGLTLGKVRGTIDEAEAKANELLGLTRLQTAEFVYRAILDAIQPENGLKVVGDSIVSKSEPQINHIADLLESIGCETVTTGRYDDSEDDGLAGYYWVNI